MKACADHFTHMVPFDVHRKVLRNGYARVTDGETEPHGGCLRSSQGHGSTQCLQSFHPGFTSSNYYKMNRTPV